MVVKDIKAPKIQKKKSLYRASSMDRAGAALFDLLIIIMPIISVLLAPIKQKIKIASLVNEYGYLGLYLFLSVGIVFVTLFLYSYVSQYFFQKTLGQFIFGIFVKEKGLVKLSKKATLIRSFIWSAQVLLLCITMLPIFINESWQFLHDKYSNTSVVTQSQYKYKNLWVQKVGLCLFAMAVGSVLLIKMANEGVPSQVAERTSQCTSAELLAKYDVGSEKRLEKLYSLYLLNRISKNCLEEEVEVSVYNNSNSDTVGLIKADFFKNVNNDISKKYSDSICGKNKNSYACKVTKLKSYGEEFNLEDQAPLYAKIVLAKKQYQSGKLESLEKTINSMPDIDIVSGFKAGYAAKVAWGKTKDKKQIFNLVKGSSSTDEQATFQMWSCNKFMQQSCSHKNSKACGAFREIAYVPEDNKELFELTKLSLDVCEQNFEQRYELRDVERLRKILIQKRRKKMKSLLGIVVNSKHSDLLKQQAASYYISFAENEEDVAPMYIYWMSGNHNLVWKNIGEEIYKKYYSFSSGEKLIGIANVLNKAFPSELSEKRIVLSALVNKKIKKQPGRNIASEGFPKSTVIDLLKKDVL